MAETITVYGQTFSNVTGVKLTDGSSQTVRMIKPEGSISITQNGTVDVTGYASANVNVSGGGSVEEKDVNFYDYDGTLLHSYTKSEFLALTAMPANPTHTGLTAQGWNWSLADAQTWVTNYDGCCIGQLYITDDEKTKFYINLDSARSVTFTGSWSGIGGNPSTIDWGDGSTPETIGNPSTITHSYSNSGQYTVSLTAGSRETALLRVSNCELAQLATEVKCGRQLRTNGNTFGSSKVRTISIASDTTFEGGNTFKNCFDLKCFICKNLTTLGDEFFLNCSALEVCSFVNCSSINQWAFIGCCSLKDTAMDNFANATFTSRGSRDEDGLFFNCSQIRHCSNIPTVTFKNAFKYCLNLERITFSSSCTRIASYQFYGCHNLKDIVFPASLTKLEMFAFGYCLSLGTLDFRAATAVPTLESLVFNSTNDTYTIVVPDALYNDWIAASGWSSISSHIISASDYANL